MAAIDFKCDDCGEKFFEIVSMSNRAKVVCPKCSSKNVKQIFEGKCNAGGSAKGSGGCSSSGGCGGCTGCK